MASGPPRPPSNLDHPVSSLIITRGRRNFARRIRYPFGDVLDTVTELNDALDWIVENLIGKFDDANVNKIDWYDFIWNTFRSLRSKATALRMIDVTAVYFYEFITRFHIFSSHNMVPLVPVSFSEKLNYENLGNCLISLNELFEDLRLRHIDVESEAEFRAYFILHFAESPYISVQIGHLRPDVRKSPKVRFALKCLSAICNNNFIEFFRLVEQANFLTACMLHRYFYGVRKEAIKRMCKAFANNTRYPKADVIDLLSFEDENELKQFCCNVGIEVDNSHVVLLKNPVIAKDPPPKRLSRRLIELKRADKNLVDILNGEA